MADQRQIEITPAASPRQQAARRLVDHHRLRRILARQGLHAFGLQHNEPAGQCQRALRRTVGGDVAVEIGSGQRHDQEAIRMALGEGGD